MTQLVFSFLSLIVTVLFPNLSKILWTILGEPRDLPLDLGIATEKSYHSLLAVLLAFNNF